jgi:chromosome segregation ATPase
MQENDSALKQVSESISKLKNETIKKEEAVERIEEMSQKLNNAINSCQNRIEEIKNNGSIKEPFKNILINNLQAQFQNLETQKNWIEGVKTDVVALKVQNVSLQKIIEKRERELVEKDNIIQQIKAERERQAALLNEKKQQLQEYEAKLDEKERLLAESRRENERNKAEAIQDKGKALYEEGRKQYETFLNLNKNILLGREKKAKPLRDALATFKTAYEKYGNTDAQRKMLEILNNPKYEKFLTED